MSIEVRKQLNSVRLKTLARIEGEGLSINVALPLLEKPVLKGMDSIWPRIIILASLKSLSEYPEDKDAILKWMSSEGISPFLSRAEHRMVNKSHLEEQNAIDLSWYKESLYAMLWTVRMVSDMNFPSGESDVIDYLKGIPPETSIDIFRTNLILREGQLIWEELDYYYHLHWLARHSESSLHRSVVMERRKALEWVCNETMDWDEVVLDT